MTDPDWLARCRKYGDDRIAVSTQARSLEDWQRLWKDSANPYTFRWGDCWKQTVEYKVDDFPAEVGFYIDVLGLDSNALGPEFAMITSPDAAFYLSFKPAGNSDSTPPDAIRVQFMLDDVCETAAELERRGIVFETPLRPCEPGSPLYTGVFRSPHGIAIDLWGLVIPHGGETAAAER